MKLHVLALALAVHAKENKRKLEKVKKVARKGRPSNARTVQEDCSETFARNFGQFQSQLDVKTAKNERSGSIQIHNYPNDANCFVAIDANHNCKNIKIKMEHAGILLG